MSIKASELRIGNLVYDPNHYGGGREIEIDSIHVTSETLFWWDDLQPISLTEEWLVKFGFEKVNNTHYTFNGLNISPKSNGYLNEANWENFYVSNNGFNTEVNYVHSLQNLYFALTGEELTIK